MCTNNGFKSGFHRQPLLKHQISNALVPVTSLPDPLRQFEREDACARYVRQTYIATGTLVASFCAGTFIAAPLGLGIVLSLKTMSIWTVGPVVAAWVASGVYPFRALWVLENHKDAAPLPVSVRGPPVDKVFVCAVSPKRMRVALALAGSMGVFFAPVAVLATMIHPMLLPTAGALTVGCVSGATWFAFKVKKPGTLLSWHPPLYAAVGGLLSVQVLYLVAHTLGLGSGFFDSATSILFSGVGIGVFSALAAADAQAVVASYENQKLDPAGHAVALALDCINVLSDVVQSLIMLIKTFPKDDD